jgi:aspartyl-tRNA synthetase
VFVDLRDRAGIVQISFNPDFTPTDVLDAAASLQLESVVLIEGEVVLRPPEVRNAEMATGDIEVRAKSLKVVGPAIDVAIPVAGGKGANLPAEELRLRYRYLDLRRPELQKNLMMRHRLMQITRRFLDELGYLEIETPILTKPTPEGARDFLVPSRVHEGEFYALPQSPQLYKQLLMMSGYDRYFQIARCFRDEDLRADRQPEFTQIDIEASFVTREDIYTLTEGLLTALFAEINVEIQTPLRRMSYADAMERYGCDRPDLRYGLEIRDVTAAFASSEFAVTRNAIAAGGRVRGICIPNGASFSRKQVDEIEAEAKAAGAAGLLRLKRVDGKLDGPAAKFLDEAAQQQLGIADGELMLLVAAPDHIANPALDRVRQDVARRMGLIPEGAIELVWITDFPMFAVDPETGKVDAVHHPFTAPNPDDLEWLESDPARVRALAYDIVLNGTELGGGSIRINDPFLQRRVLNVLGIDDATAEARFGFLLEALGSGAPPHGGIAFGFDRISMMWAGAQSLRDVIAFPKTTAARALFEGAPSVVPAEELAELHLIPAVST